MRENRILSARALEILLERGTATIEISSASMSPELRPGDEVLVEKAGASELRTGDVVVLNAGGTARIHRFLHRKGGRKIVTKGDALARKDPPLKAEALVGIARGKIHGKTKLPFNRKKAVGLAIKGIILDAAARMKDFLTS